MMKILDDMLSDEDYTAGIHKDFRIWMSCEPKEGFPLGLLQRSLKVTNEPPKGVKQGLMRTFKTVITQSFLDEPEHSIWGPMVFAVSFLHSVVQERRKFGPLGWCVPYEFNYSDLQASLQFIRDYLMKIQESATGNQANMQITQGFGVMKYMVSQI